ncbi:transglycosylase domain-containing protein [Escherichia coli]
MYLGYRAYGVAAASQVYFGKPADQLSLSEIAVIAGLPKHHRRSTRCTRWTVLSRVVMSCCRAC